MQHSWTSPSGVNRQLTVKEVYDDLDYLKSVSERTDEAVSSVVSRQDSLDLAIAQLVERDARIARLEAAVQALQNAIQMLAPTPSV